MPTVHARMLACDLDYEGQQHVAGKSTGDEEEALGHAC